MICIKDFENLTKKSNGNKNNHRTLFPQEKIIKTHIYCSSCYISKYLYLY